ncbi:MULTISPECIES: helix-turn-helix transcriptional regulator [unclassified Comamonas]|uniref:helix-turn-helix domain-containing protein n=1 Tax=unclassified Comamonas TaxID=2638500 RepID=UPI0028A5AF5D|nr:helix-turn-helix transcriptional regulator [Comamonas sp.]
MKYDETTRTSKDRLKEAAMLGKKLHALRMAMRITQAEAAARAGLSRSTAVLIEAGDESRTLSQLLRYLDALSPRTSLLALLTDDIAAVKNMQADSLGKRVRMPRRHQVHEGQPPSSLTPEKPGVESTPSARRGKKEKTDAYDF